MLIRKLRNYSGCSSKDTKRIYNHYSTYVDEESLSPHEFTNMKYSLQEYKILF